MARKRMIDPNIWQSEDFSKLSTLSKLVFIGLFSLADDEGRGRCNPVYLRSTLFPYEENIRSTDINKTLSEISSNMSVVFYCCDGSNYYSLYNWNTWQKIDRPTKSKIPQYDEKTMQILFDESSSNSHLNISTNNKKIENNNKRKKEKKFIPPTLNDVRSYINESKLKVDAEQFYNYFTEGNWIDSKGNPVKSWKQKILTWNSYSTLPKSEKKQIYNNYEQRNYNNLDQFYANQ